MEYSYSEREAHHVGSNWFGHLITMDVVSDRYKELKEFLEEQFGKRGQTWRETTTKINYWAVSQRVIIRFTHKSDAIKFKLSWQGDPPAKDVFSPKSGLGAWTKYFQTNNRLANQLQNIYFKPTFVDYDYFFPVTHKLNTGGIGLYKNSCNSWWQYQNELEAFLAEENTQVLTSLLAPISLDSNFSEDASLDE